MDGTSLQMLTQDQKNLTGQQIGNYKIEEQLISRNVSNLYLANDVKLGHQILLEVAHTEDPEIAAQFERNMETVSQIKHPGVGSVNEVGRTSDGSPYAVIEHFPGQTLAAQLNIWQQEGYRLSKEDALKFVRGLAEALSAGQSAGLIHHDLRPKNIFLTEDNDPILIDLGIPPTVANGDTALATETLSETLDYASPEEVEGKAINRRSNIYSLGVLLYELLAGHRPTLPISSWDIFERSTMPKEVPLEEARAGLAGETYRLVRNCLWRQEWSRFETADEFVAAIDTALLAEQTLPQPVQEADRNRLFIIGPIVALAVILLGYFIWNGLKGSGDSTATSTPISGIIQDTATHTPTTEASPTQTLTPLPSPEVGNNMITLTSPIPDDDFEGSDRILFQWTWFGVLKEGEQFTIYVAPIEDPENFGIIAVVDELNSSTLNTYITRKRVSDLNLGSGIYLWYIALEAVPNGGTIDRTENRRFTIISTSTPTPVNTVPPTETATATPTPTAEVVSCEKVVPPGWSTHILQSGESPVGFAVAANVAVQRILDVNCLDEAGASLLTVGSSLIIPPPLATATPTQSPLQPTNTPGGNNGDNTPKPTNTPATPPTALPPATKIP